MTIINSEIMNNEWNKIVLFMCKFVLILLYAGLLNLPVERP